MLASYAEELERSKLPGYVCRYDDFDAGEDFERQPVRDADAGAATAVAHAASPRCVAGPAPRPHPAHPRRQSVLRGPHVAAPRETRAPRASHTDARVGVASATASDRRGPGGRGSTITTSLRGRGVPAPASRPRPTLALTSVGWESP